MFRRELITGQKIIITDGIAGGGKDLICKLISSLPKVDQWVLDYRLDQIAALCNIKKMDLDTATYLIKSNFNANFYDNSMLRVSNFRKSDKTGVPNHPRFKKFFKERMNPDDKKVFLKFKNKIFFHYCAHMTANFAEPFFRAFKKQLLFIQLFRSPLNAQMLEHLASWSKIWEKSKSRDGYIKLYNKKLKKNFPHFVSDVSDTYLKANKFEKAVIILEKIYNKRKINLNIYEKKYGSKVIRIPFENLVINPKKYLYKISKILNVKIDWTVLKVMKKNNVPRNFILSDHDEVGKEFMVSKIKNQYFKRLIKLNDYYKKFILNKY